MLVLDTHAWMWFVDAPDRLSREAARSIARADRLGVSAISVFEFVDLVERGRVEPSMPARAWVRNALAVERTDLLPLTAEIAVDAAQLHFAGDPIDRIVYATARAAGAQLVTRDQRLHAFDPDRTVW